MPKQKVLITNDDGIHSSFLRSLVDAHKDLYEVYVAAPLREQSWVSRAITRLGDVKVNEDNRFGCKAWSIDGTPTDCVNIALGHLIPKSEYPVAILSGINLGFNASYPFILSSGTISGALEGLMWGIPGIAFSQMVPEYMYESLRMSHEELKGDFKESVKNAGIQACTITQNILKKNYSGLIVHNINFPINTELDTVVEETIPEIFRCGTLFQPVKKDTYSFKFTSELNPLLNLENTDRACLLRGNISYTQLDYARLCTNAPTINLKII